MTLRNKIMLLAMVPLFLAVTAISMMTLYQARSLEQAEVASVENSMLLAKKSELLNYLSLAESSIRHIYDAAAPDDVQAKAQVKQILTELTYGDDGYFFVYDYEGVNLVHPTQPFRIGKNWFELRDGDDNPLIQQLIDSARTGGGFVRYIWEKPSTGELADKISYAVSLEKWGWMVGTGIYIDDVARQTETIKAEISSRIDDTAIFILVVSAGATLMVFFTVIAINLHERRLADAKLKELTKRIVATQEEERGRVARDLHDGISQILVSVKFALETARAQIRKQGMAPSPFLEQGIERLNVATKEVRRISRDLRPSDLDDLGLSPALECLAMEFSERTGIHVDIETVAYRNLLSPEVKITLFRVAQEALTNIERHANADQVSLELSAPCGAVTMMIRDNGCGFDAKGAGARKDPKAGIGLRNMQERLEHHDGELTITSNSKGTTVTALLPKGVMRAETLEAAE